MRNLKRALSLAMASVMLLGMMVVGTSAASFQDVDESNDVEAIEVMNAVGVMQGDERGFRPNDPINRNEIAKVMALLLKLSPEDYAYAVTPFTDVPDWAAPYVAACYANGITNGTSATTYSGANNVTAVQAARMMLRALGYLKNPQDDGDDWVLATATQASKIGLFDGVNQTGVHTALTRNQVATMAVNALEATMVEDHSSKGLEVNTPDGTTVQVGYTPDYRKVSVERENDKNYTGANGDGAGTQQLCEYLYGTDLKKTGAVADDFGRPGSIWKYKGKEVVGSPKTPVVTYTNKPSASTIKSDLKGYDLSKINGVYVNGDDTTSYSISVPADIRADAPKLGGQLGNGTRLEIYANNDNEITDIVVIKTYLAQANADYDAGDDELDVTVVTGDITLNDATLDGDDFAIENYKEDDYLLITVTLNGDGTTYDVQSVAPATIVSGLTVSAWDDNDYVTAGGNKYEYNATATDGTSNVEGKTLIDGTSPFTMQKTEYTMILDGNGYVIGVKATGDEEQLTDYLFVKDSSQVGFDYVAKVVFMDGTSKTVTVSKVDNEDANGYVQTADNTLGTTANYKVVSNRFYTYTVDKNGEYELKTVADSRQGVTTGAAGIDPDQASGKLIVGTGAPSEPTNSKTVFVAKDKAYVGVKNAPKVTGASSVFYLKDAESTPKYLLAAYTATKGSSSTDASEFVYILNTTQKKVGLGKDNDDNNYYIYKAVVNGKKTTLNANTNIIGDPVGMYEITGYTDGYADLTYVGNGSNSQVKGVTGVTEATISHKGDVVKAGAQSYVLDNDATIISIDTTDSDATKTISAASLNNLKAGNYAVWVVQISGTDTDVKVLYVVKVP